MRLASSLLPDGVEAALLDLDLGADQARQCGAWLDEAERVQAARFRFARDRDRYVARRGQVRGCLAEETGEAPQRLRISVDGYGKPFLADHPDLHFNISHTHGLALCVIGRGVPVGCDIERRDPAMACPAVAARLFAPAERDALAALPPEQWLDGFFNCWTRKEAYVKALGLGLSYPLDAFSVSVAPAETARLIDALPGWSLASFEAAPGFQAAVVAASVTSQSA